MIIAKYKFNSSIDTLPVFNDNYEYTYFDIDNGDSTIIRTIVSETLPNSMSFEGKTGLLEVLNINISSVETITNMFKDCTALTTINPYSFNTEYIVDMTSIFENCSSLKDSYMGPQGSFSASVNLPVASLTTFKNNEAFDWTTPEYVNDGDLETRTALTIGTSVPSYSTKAYFNMDTSVIPDNAIITKATVSYVVSRSFSLIETIYARFYVDEENYLQETEINTNKTTVTLDITDYIDNLLNGETFIAVSSSKNLAYGFYLYEATFTIDYYVDIEPDPEGYTENYIDFSSWNTSDVTSLDGMFFGCSSLIEVNVSNWETSKVTNASWLFGNCSSLIQVDLTDWNTNRLQYAHGMFGIDAETGEGCKHLTSVGDLSNWNVSNLIIAGGMFSNCVSLLTVGDLSNWNVMNLEDGSNMFKLCLSLTSLGNLSRWNTSNLTSAKNMFNELPALESIGDLSNWNMSNVTNISGMFFLSEYLINLDLSKWDISSVTNMEYLISGSTTLTTLNVSNWVLNDNCQTTEFIDGCDNLKLIYVNNSNDIMVSKLVESLPDRTGKESGKIIIMNCTMSGNVDATAVTEAAVAKNWYMQNYMIVNHQRKINNQNKKYLIYNQNKKYKITTSYKQE